MKKLLFILTLSLISIAVFSQDYFEGISGLKFLSSDTVNVFNDFIFNGDTIKKDSLVYVEIKPDSIRFKYINGVFTNWIKIGEVSNETYDNTTWDNVTTVAPSKNAIRDKINTMERVHYCASTMTVNRGTLNTGTVSDLCAVGGTDVNITELSGADPLRVTFAFSGVQRVSSFVFYGDYNGGASHVVWVEMYNYLTTAWDFIGEFGNSSTKQWYSFNIFTPDSYLSGGNAQVRISHQGNGISYHSLILDYVDLNFGGAGGGTNTEASTVSFTPGGNISGTNVQSAITELDTEKVQLSPTSAQGGFSDLTSYKLNGVNIFGSQTTNKIPYWDGTKFVSITDGTNGQALTTNGSGVYSFTDVGGYEINTPQALSGTSVTWDLNNGRDATITLTGNTTITITNATDGVTGTLWVTNAASVYTITFAGYTNAIDPFIRLAANMVITSGGSKSDDFTFKYNGVKMNWNGTLNRE